MIDVYGIPNCATVKKARSWLEEHGLEYEFHDFKKTAPTETQLRRWLEELPLDKLINKKGTSWRGLSAAEQARAAEIETALALLQEKPTLIKRPLVEAKIGAEEKISVGFDADVFDTFLG